MKNALKKLEESKANLVEQLKKLKPAKANGEGDSEMEDKEESEGVSKDELYSILSSYGQYIDRQLSYIYSEINSLYNHMYKHEKGHIPQLSPSQLQKVLVNCDLEDDFEVAKPVIYASKGQNYISFEVK